MPEETLISEIEALIRRDPARRGLIGSDGNGPGLGELAVAASFFADKDSVTGVGLMTGFFIPNTERAGLTSNCRQVKPSQSPGNAETDGPPGTILLADILCGLGVPTTIITDELCEPVVRTACSAGSAHRPTILVSPLDENCSHAWRTDSLLSTTLQQISHFVAIERVGPGHTHLLHETWDSSKTFDHTSESGFTNDWLPGHCCNMRGESIDAYSANLHLLIEAAKARNPAIRVIGVGDGGNEIGMGRFTWNELRARIPGTNADRVPCRIPADATIVAGVSNWGAYALAAAIAVHHDRVDLLDRHTAASQQHVVEQIVSRAGAVDGVTRQREPTVDGLPFLTQIQPWIAIRERLGLQP
ncbi:MAG: DUF4392 domain-containing protein [Rhodopirellula sp.]|nr:DUF4392 domain-containing protein [Rhodopirellula sp.]